ncbi:hypothetical protein ASPSYDRAFT_51789 [Aspergillus sydowii CBS 593.65]|uniref:Uncharacterized protein n=1 Tax=Aspergillus sydowii CBS 593.65 TaxID=1036612 RepID=A0A1L9T021_9EURO|nr:uncharacterized protein ASPSYDRAFT_51789 [Aspergillus sydowii CBS 593.65]OJJ52653.1 hypothetical protein ASPSYDRAFT_51789 [Aspergillus sydowii CBS 593.65]
MTPLAQNSVKLDAKRIRYVQDAGNSPDPQILFWVTDFRASRARKKKIQKDKQLHATREIFRVDFDRALESALGDPVAFQNMKDSMTAENIIPDCHTDSEHLFTPFFGTLAAKIGFVLDYAAVSPASDSFSGHGLTESRSRIQLPWALKGCQFDETNVLIWTFNFQAFSPLDQNNISDSCNDDVSHYHQELLDSSNARIVFLCGPRATNALRLVHKKRYFLELRGFHYTVYLSRTPFSTGPQYRLFICCPALPAQIWSTRRCEGAQIGEALRFAISMLSLDGIRPYSVETVMVVGTILSWARAHRMGKPSVTVETINFHVALWLTRKGIPLDRLKRIVEIAGNLPRALLMILYCLNAELPETHQPSKKRFPDQAEEYHLQLTSSKKVRCYEPFDMGACSKIHALVREGIKDENEKYVERLKSLGVDLSVGHSSGQSSVQSPVQSSPSSEDATDLLIGKELPSPETLTTVKSVILRSHNNQLTKKERALDKKLDVDITDAMRLGSEAVDLGILDPSISRPKRQNRPKIRGRIWERQVDVFRQSEYSYRVDPAGSRKISVKYCPIVFPAGEDIGNGEAYVKIVINPPGKAHPQCYATRATDVDPASRMAFQLRFQPFKGPEVKRYATHDALTSIYRANTLVDILLGIPIEDIARKPRRYIYFWGESRIPAGLERFMGGSYTEGTILDV